MSLGTNLEEFGELMGWLVEDTSWMYQRKPPKCDHTPGTGTLEVLRGSSHILLGYRCSVCGMDFALGRMYMEPREVMRIGQQRQ